MSKNLIISENQKIEKNVKISIKLKMSKFLENLKIWYDLTENVNFLHN